MIMVSELILGDIHFASSKLVEFSVSELCRDRRCIWRKEKGEGWYLIKMVMFCGAFNKQADCLFFLKFLFKFRPQTELRKCVANSTCDEPLKSVDLDISTTQVHMN